MKEKSGRFLVGFDSSRKSRSLFVAWLLVAVFFFVCMLFPLFSALTYVRLGDFKAVFFQGIWRRAMLNTLVECVFSTALSVLIGYVFAYAVVKGDIPARRFFAAIPILHLITPPFVGGLAFILLFGKQGFITHKILGLNISLYGFSGLLIAQTLCFFPMAYLICVQTLKGINENLENAARGMGAKGLRIFFTITLPLSLPGIISSALFVAVSVLSDFGNPLIVGGRFRVLAVEIYSQLTGWLKIGVSVVLGIVLVVPSLALFFFQNGMSKKIGRKSATIGGKGGAFPDFEKRSKSTAKTFDLARILLTIFVSFVSLLILAQFFAIVAGSFQKLWGIDLTFTASHIKSVFRYAKELKNSLSFAFVSAFLSTVLAILSAYMVHRAAIPLKKSMDVFSQLPAAIPGSLFGLAISLSANRVGFHNSKILIIAAMTVAFLPFAYRIISDSLAQISPTLDDGAMSLGANQLSVLATVLAPISKNGIAGAFVYCFIRGVGTLSSVIFLVSFDTPLASVRIINLAEQGDWGKSASLALVLTAGIFFVIALGFLCGKIFKDGKKWRFFR